MKRASCTMHVARLFTCRHSCSCMATAVDGAEQGDARLCAGQHLFHHVPHSAQSRRAHGCAQLPIRPCLAAGLNHERCCAGCPSICALAPVALHTSQLTHVLTGCFCLPLILCRLAPGYRL